MGIDRETVRRARDDIATFAAQCTGVPLWPHQLALATSTARVRCVASGRQSGKTFALAMMATHAGFAEPGRHVLIISAGDEASKDLLAQCSELTQAPILAGSVVDAQSHSITLSNGSTIRSVPASEKAIRGKAVDILLVDEACYVSEEVWAACRYTVIARPGSKIIMSSTPYGRKDRFFSLAYRAGLRGEDGYASFHWPSTASPLVDAELLAMWAASSADREFRREVLAEWTDSAGQYFTDDEIEAALSDYELIPPAQANRRRAVSAGVDWGFSRDSSAVVVLAEAGPDDLPGRWPEHTFWCPWISEGVHVSYSAFVDRVVEVAKGYRIRRIASEVNGVGQMPTAELTRRLRFHHGTVVPVTTTAQSKQDAFGAIKVLLSQGRLALPRHPALLSQLAALEYEERDSGNVHIAVPERSGHDDLCMAAALAVDEADVASGSTGGRVMVAQGRVPPVKLVRGFDNHAEPPVAVVKPGEQRPVDRMTEFARARKHPAYRPPGADRWR